MKPRLLDLFCGDGGAAMGYHRAGFDVVGVDLNSRPHYPFEFHQGDAMTWPLDGFDAIHASPPCQHYSRATAWRGDRGSHPDLVGPVRDRLTETAVPWVIENVREAKLYHPVMLCGTWFGLKVIRHRYFEAEPRLAMMFATCNHEGCFIFEHKQERAYGNAMGCEWMARDGHREAIPPAYTEWIGGQLLRTLAAAA